MGDAARLCVALHNDLHGRVQLVHHEPAIDVLGGMVLVQRRVQQVDQAVALVDPVSGVLEQSGDLLQLLVPCFLICLGRDIRLRRDNCNEH